MSTELNILKVAILNEQEGFRFYREASEKVKSEDAKKAFLQLAQDEKDHEDVLRKMYEQMRHSQRISVYDPDGGYIVEPRIFRKNKETVATDDYEMAVYKIGILMEEASERYYRESAEKTGSTELKKMLLYLADWEVSHRDALKEEYERLREEWWKKEGLE